VAFEMGKEIIDKVLSGLSDKNIRFEDLRKLLLSLGFDERIKGDHYIFAKPDIIEIINIQPLRDGKAKAYQVKQVRNLILRYKLHKEV
jgi:predicted RNA binding protein YcfA (HicA-like mRNA interferase family)